MIRESGLLFWSHPVFVDNIDMILPVFRFGSRWAAGTSVAAAAAAGHRLHTAVTLPGDFAPDSIESNKVYLTAAAQ